MIVLTTSRIPEISETGVELSANDALRLLDGVAHLAVRAGVICGGSPAIEGETGVPLDHFLGRDLKDIGHPTGAGSVERLLTSGLPVDLQLGDDFDSNIVRLRLLGEFESAAYVELRSLTEFQITHDDLTSLPERAATLSHLRRCLQVASKENETAVLFCDIDNFKLVNDRLGHDAGDELLTEVASRLRSVVRGVDLVGRYGGDEFVVVTPGVTDPAEATEFAARVFEAVTGPMSCAGVRVSVSVSMGLVISGEDDRSAQSLLNKADLAMYEAKRNGRGRLELFRPGMADRAADRTRNQALLVDAIKNDELVIHFQHVVPADPRSDHPTGVEALARWQHPTDGLVMPDAFLNDAEESGFITTLGTHLIRIAIRDFVQWPGEAPEFLAVNMSPQQLGVEGVSVHILDAIREFDLDPARVVVELTEGAFAKGQPVLDNLRSFREHGVRIFLDDFGTGYSSLSYLRRFPVDGIKIDQSFLHPTLDQGLVKIIVEIALTMGVVTVAEGIETKESLEQVAALGVTYAQGYLIDRPAPAGNLDAWTVTAR